MAISLADAVNRLGQRNGFIVMYHSGLRTNGDPVVRHIKDDPGTKAVFVESGWKEYVPQAEPFEAKRISPATVLKPESVGQSREDALMAELQAMKAKYASLENGVTESEVKEADEAPEAKSKGGRPKSK